MAWRELGPDETNDLRSELGTLVNRWIRRLTGRADDHVPRDPDAQRAEDAETEEAFRAVQAMLGADAPQLARLGRPSAAEAADGDVDELATRNHNGNGNAEGGELFDPTEDDLTPAERAVSHLARLNTLHSLQAAVQDRIDKLVHDAGDAGAGYPDIAKALHMTRQNARKRWPEAVHHGPGRRPKRELPDF